MTWIKNILKNQDIALGFLMGVAINTKRLSQAPKEE